MITDEAITRLNKRRAKPDTEGLPPRLAKCVERIWRHREKGGVKDLEKARWYLDRYIAQHKAAVIK